MTLTEDNEQPNWFSPDDPRGDLPKLVAHRDQLITALRETEDPLQRSDLAYQLRVTSEQIEALSDPIPDQEQWASPPAEAAVTGDLTPEPSWHGDDQVPLGDVTPPGPDDQTFFRADDHIEAQHTTEWQNLGPAVDWPEEPPMDPQPAEPGPYAWPEPERETVEQVAHDPDHQDPDERELDARLPEPPPVDLRQPLYEEPVDGTAAAEFPYDDLGPERAETGHEARPGPTDGGMGVPGGGERGPFAPAITEAGNEPLARSGFVRPSGPVLAVVGVSLALLAGVLWFGDSRRSSGQINESIAPAGPEETTPTGDDGLAVLGNVRAVLQGLGLPGVVVDVRDGVIHVGGPVPSQADQDAVAGAVRSVADTYPVDLSALVVMAEGEAADQAAAPAPIVGRAESLQTELDRILAATPLIFGPGQAALTELHQRILNNAVLALQGYPGFRVTVAGFTDDQGDEAQNRQLSLTRADNVKAYLVAQGLPEDGFQVEARGEDVATGSAGLAGLERRVELEVDGAGEPAGPQETIRVGIVAPSASNDLAFTQSMVDAVNLLAGERPIELSVTDNTFVPDEAAAAIRAYAEQGYDLVIAHGSQFGSALIDIAPQHPEVAFAWGTASDTFGQPNIYAYDAAAQEGGYVLGAMAGLLSTSAVVGVVGPIEVGDAAQYVTGFQAGARAAAPATDLRVSFTGSFSDIGLASEAAQAHLGAGADVLTGSAQMVVGAIAAAQPSGALWFGTQANQASLAPDIVVASQVYHWEVALRPVIADIEAGTLNGTSHTANLANGGLVIEYNPDYGLNPEVRQRADQLTAEIIAGSITPPG